PRRARGRAQRQRLRAHLTTMSRHDDGRMHMRPMAQPTDPLSAVRLNVAGGAPAPAQEPPGVHAHALVASSAPPATVRLDAVAASMTAPSPPSWRRKGALVAALLLVAG